MSFANRRQDLFLAAGVLVIAIGVLALWIQREQSPAKQAGGVSGSSSAATGGGAKLPVVTLDGTYFVRSAPLAPSTRPKRFIPVGAHWVPAKAAMQWPLEWDPADIDADFAKMHELGYTLVRFDMLWGWFEPRAGEYNEEAFRQLDYLISLAHKYEIYLHPSLFIGGEVGEAYWDVPWRGGRNPHTDPEMLRLETRHAAELGRRYGTESAIIAWDLTDEPPFWITTGLTDAAAIQWTRAITSGIRQHDKMHPIVVGTSGQETSHGPFRSDNLVVLDNNNNNPEKKTDRGGVSFFSVHPFTIYKPELFPDAMLSERGTYGAAFEIALSSGAGRPAMIHEMGASSAQYAPEWIANYERANLYSALGAGSIGVNLWCFTDAAPIQRNKLPYLRTPQETEWGMTTWDRKDKPRGREFRKFSQVIAQLDLTDLSAAPADAAIIIPEEWSKPLGDFTRSGLRALEEKRIPYVSVEDAVGSAAKSESGNTWLMGAALSSFILARRAGLKADFPREYGGDREWQKRPIVLLPSPLTSTGTPFLTHVHTDFYEHAKTYVEGGGYLYASFAADAAVPDMDALFGAHLADANTAMEITIRIVKAFGELKPGDVFSLTVPSPSARYWGSVIEVSHERSGEVSVIAVDQDGHPALVQSTLGKGKTLLSAYPIESYLAMTPSAFDRKAFVEKPQLVDLLYRAMREASGVKPAFTSDHPTIEVTSLSSGVANANANSERGYAIVVNHGPQPRKTTVQSSRRIRTLARISPEGPQAITLTGAQWSMDLAAYEGAILEWR